MRLKSSTRRRLIRGLVASSCLLGIGRAGAQSLQLTAPSSYDAITDRGPRQEPALVRVGPAGYTFTDPVFGSTISRITDGRTRPDAGDLSYRTPSSTQQNAWSADGRFFYVVSTDGTIVPFAFDRATGRAARIDGEPGGAGGLTLRFYIEPTFSYLAPGVIFGSYSGPGASLRTIDQFDFATRSYSRLLDLDTLARGLNGTYVGAIMSSGGSRERVLAMFGGASQDRHHYLVVFDRNNPASRRLLDTATSTLDGRATRQRLGFTLHAAAIDRSGRYVTLYPSAADRLAPRSAAPNYVWDTADDTVTELPGIDALSNGHDAYGYGVRVNQDCCTATTWDAAQWQLRSLADPLITRDLVVPVLNPKEVYLAEHPSWHNAAPDRLVPYITGLYRYGNNTTEWRAWDDEIVGVETDLRGGSGARVWRLAHHRSDVRDDVQPDRISFWYTPRPNVSPDGRWVLFTSNWEKSLGRDPDGDTSTRARQDVFLVALEADGSSPPPASSRARIVTTSLPDARRGRAYAAQLAAAGVNGTAAWSIVVRTLPPGLSLDGAGAISGVPARAGVWVFTVELRDAEGAVSKVMRIRVLR